MIVKRIATAFKQQDWTQVVLELVLVVLGVFVALQFDNWNEDNNNQQALKEVLLRVSSELELNENVINSYQARLEEVQSLRDKAREALNTCDESDEARTAINNAITMLTGDFSPSLSNETLPQLNRRDPYLDLLSSDFRWALAVYSNHIHEEQRQLIFNAGLRWDQHIIKHPYIGADLGEESVGFLLSEDLSMSEICNDAKFSRQYFITSIFLDSTLARLERFRQRMNEFKTILDAELAMRNALPNSY
jgi:hypothetical protein